jgi:hypothetical protein
MHKPSKIMSGAEFKLHFALLLSTLKDDDEVFFGSGDLSFYRPKERGPVNGPRLVQIEFNEVYKILADPDN